MSPCSGASVLSSRPAGRPFCPILDCRQPFVFLTICFVDTWYSVYPHATATVTTIRDYALPYRFVWLFVSVCLARECRWAALAVHIGLLASFARSIVLLLMQRSLQRLFCCCCCHFFWTNAVRGVNALWRSAFKLIKLCWSITTSESVAKRHSRSLVHAQSVSQSVSVVRIRQR